MIGICNSWSNHADLHARIDDPALRIDETSVPVLKHVGSRGAPGMPERGPPHFTRGWGRLFLDHVLQASEGCDFDFLRGRTPVRDEESAGPSHG